MTTVTSTSPSSALAPIVVVTVASAGPSSPATQPKSAIDQPGLIGHGRYVGSSAARLTTSANVV